MTFDYAKTAATGDRLLKRFGAASSLTRRTEGAYDPNTGSSTVTETVQPCTAAMFDFNTQLSGTRFDGQSLIQSGDKQVYVSSVGMAAPAPGDFLVFGGVSYAVIAVKRLAPSGVDVLYELQVRQ